MIRILTLIVAVTASCIAGCETPRGDPCSGVTCGGNGVCVSDGIAPRCACNDGYRPRGLDCVPIGADGDADDGGDADADDAGDAEVEGGSVCGNGIVEPPEECDDDPPPTRACTTSCGSSGTETCALGCRWSGRCDPPVEACNGVDDDCDTEVDEGYPCIRGRVATCATTCGSTGRGTCSDTCAAPAGAACTPPLEACNNGADDDCDTETDELTPEQCRPGTVVSCTTSCSTTGTGTCTDGCSPPLPAACTPPAEVCNDADDDCDGETDETFACRMGAAVACTTTCSTTGSGTCTSACALPTGAACTPPAEVCGNGVDDDCDGATDEGCACTGVLSVPSISDPMAMTFGEGNFWITDWTSARRVYRVRRSDGAVVSFDVPAGESNLSGITYQAGSLWGVAYPSGRIYNLSLSGSTLSSFAGPENYLHGIAHDGTDLWISDGDLDGTASIYRLSVAGTVLANFDTTASAPYDMEIIAGGIWAVSRRVGPASTLKQFDRSTGAVLATLPLPECPSGQCAVATDGACLWVANASTIRARPLPDTGGRIVFVSNRSGRYEVWAMNDDGTGLRQFTFGAGTHATCMGCAGAWSPRWSPDGTKIAFVYGLNHPAPMPPSRLMVMNADGTALREVATGFRSYHAGISWRADGREVFSDDDIITCNGRVVAIDVTTGGMREVFHDSLDGYRIPCGPDAHPTDANLVVYTAYNCGDNHGGLRVRTLAAGTETTIVPPGVTYTPRWSPRGDRVAYDLLHTGGSFFRTVASTGGAPTTITPSPAVSGIRYPDWTDAGFIFSNQNGNSGIWTCNADGTSARRVVGGDAFEYKQPDWYPGRLPERVDPFGSWVKDAANPVFRNAASGWDARLSNVPEDVVEHGDRLWMYYSGNTGDQRHQLGLATSSDGITWTRHPGNPVVSNAIHGGAENWLAGVLVDGPTWRLFRMRPSVWAGPAGIWHATSSDGMTFTNHPTNPALAQSGSGWDSTRLSQPTLLATAGSYTMWFDAFGSAGRIGRATSTDAATWTKSPGTPVLGPDDARAGAWESAGMNGPEMLLIDGVYHMWYAGWSTGPGAIGHAWSADGVTWVRDPDNPVLRPGAGTWDERGISAPAILVRGGDLWMWYGGYQTAPDQSWVGLARIPARTVLFEDYFDGSPVGELIHIRPGWRCEGGSCISTTSTTRALSGATAAFLPAAESGGLGMRHAWMASDFTLEFYFYDPGSSGVGDNLMIILDTNPSGSPLARAVGYNQTCSGSAYSFLRTLSTTCVATLAPRSIGWHRVQVQVRYATRTARFCVDDRCHTDTPFDITVGALAFNNDGLDAYVDNFRVLAP